MREKLKSWTKDDFDIQWFSGTGAGGQHRNKHQNCVRITHKESGITCIGQNHRERSRNIYDALHNMADLLAEEYYPRPEKERNPETDVVRTYNTVNNRVVDHISGFKILWSEIEKDMHEMIISRKIEK